MRTQVNQARSLTTSEIHLFTFTSIAKGVPDDLNEQTLADEVGFHLKGRKFLIQRDVH